MCSPSQDCSCSDPALQSTTPTLPAGRRLSSNIVERLVQDNGLILIQSVAQDLDTGEIVRTPLAAEYARAASHVTRVLAQPAPSVREEIRHCDDVREVHGPPHLRSRPGWELHELPRAQAASVRARASSSRGENAHLVGEMVFNDSDGIEHRAPFTIDPGSPAAAWARDRAARAPSQASFGPESAQRCLRNEHGADSLPERDW